MPEILFGLSSHSSVMPLVLILSVIPALPLFLLFEYDLWNSPSPPLLNEGYTDFVGVVEWFGEEQVVIYITNKFSSFSSFPKSSTLLAVHGGGSLIFVLKIFPRALNLATVFGS